ncbi:PAS domain S-box protein [Methanoregula sp.]|uniref:PAS domain S-box protein n=1 Tax=Methanoregula sp. TaxID=2052170 RepID=UPI002C7AF00B|nr:PAS domain S-box protein [Methanoregula sp.]HVP96929.1 PAS domain S-box protein [Methanoregula sp.]
MFRVLYVDDEPGLLEIGKLYLEKDGRLSVDGVTSASGALLLMESTSYDAIIADYQMPEMDGIEFLERVRSSGNSIPFILFTGRGREEIVIQALNEGADFYLQKGGEPQAQFAELQSKILQSIYRRQAEERVMYLSRINSLLSQVNKNIVYIPDRDNLFRAICAVAIEYGKFRMAWIGIIDRKSRWIKPVASAGIGAREYLSNLAISADDIPEGRGPTGRAVREGRPAVANNIRQDPAMIPWHDAAEKFGYRSSGAFPIRCRGEVIGTFSLYAAEPEFFSSEEVALLEEVSGDISFALDNYDREKERFAAVEALSRSEERLKFALEGANDGLWDVWMETGEVYLSPRGCEILGYTPEELPEIARVWNDLVYPDDLPRTRAALDAYLEGRTEIFSIEQRLITKSGKPKWILTRGKASARNEEGRVLRMTGTHSDISERKKAEDDLRAANEHLTALEEELRAQYDTLGENQKALALSEEKYRTLVETSFDGIVIHQNGIIVYANATAVRLLGASSADEFLGKPALSFVHPDCHRMVMERIASAMKGDPQQIMHEKFLRADGSVIDVDVVAIPFIWKNAAAVHVVFRDITERKKAEDALRQSEGKNRWLAAIVESSDDAIIGKTLDGVITSWNAGAEKIYGYPAREVFGKSIALLIPPDWENELPQILEKIRHGEHIHHYETIRIRKDGKRIQISLTISPIYGPDGTITGASTIARDITEQRLAEEQLRQNQRLLASAMDLAHMVSWEYDVATGLFTFDDRFFAFYGTTSEREGGHRISGETYVREFVYPEDIPAVAEVMKQSPAITDRDYTMQMEHRIVRRDGTVRTIIVRLAPVFGADGKLAKIYGANQDITELKKAEEALRESEKRYRDMFELNNAVMFLVDLQSGKIVDANTAACHYYGYSREEFTGLDISSINIQERARTLQDMSRADGSPGAVFHFRHRKKNGEIRDVEVFSGPITLAGRQVLHSIIQDVTERNKAEEVLRESEARYRNLFTNMLEGFAYCRMIYDDAGQPLDFIYLDVNPSFDRIIGTKTVTGKRVTEVFPGIREAFPELFETYGRVASGGEPASFDIDFSPIGKWLHISVYSPEKDHFVAVFEDITVRRLANEQLKKAEEKYRHIFETALEGIYQITPKGKLLTANPAMANILGYDSAEDLTTTVTDTARQLWVHQGKRREYLRQLREHDVVRDFECEYYRKDKSLIWVSLTTHTVRGPDGNVLFSEGILTDITRRKTVESELIGREAEYRTILRTAMDGFCIISKEGRFLDVNDAFCQMTGYTREELLTRSLADIEAKETSGEIAAHSREILSKGADRFETRYRRKDGSVIDAEVSVVVTDRHGGQFVTFHHDITERKRAQTDLENARSELEQKVLSRTRELKETNESLLAEIALRNKAENEIVASLKEKEMLLKEIHHRVKNNMQVISSLLFMQARAQKDEKVKEILKESQDRIKSIALVHEKLYQSRDFDQIDYADYLRKITDHLFESYQVDPGRITLHLNAEKAVLHIDKAVPCSLIINEMISNSLKHAFPGERKGVITIDFKKSGENYIVTYSDDGIGIPDSVTFDRTESLGMQLIKGLTKQINGSIGLDRTAGTKYTISFPA